MDAIPANVERLLSLLAVQTREHAFMLLDAEGVITWWSPGAEHIFGFTCADAVGKASSILFTAEDIDKGIPRHEIETARSIGAADDDRWLVRRDGSRFWAAGAMIPLRDGQGKLLGFGKIVRNRTALWEQIETLRNQAIAAETASSRKDVFLSTLSHELRNPLAPLGNAVELIRMTAPASSELENPLKIIDRQVASLRRLVDDLLDLTRIGAGKIDLRKEVVELHEVINRAVESTQGIIREKRHRLEVLLPVTGIQVQADAARLEQVFVNLINNAAKYTPVQGRIWIDGTTDGDEAVVHVVDNGVGIPNEMLSGIFDLFTQVETTRAQSRGGLGIGLPLVKDLVTLQGGSIQVISEGPGKGSEFTVRLPLAGSDKTQ